MPLDTGAHDAEALDATVADASNPDGGVSSEHPPIVLPTGQAVDTDRLSTSEACVSCHSSSPNADAMRDPSDRPIAPIELWQSSMMANAARDPFFRAVMSAEIAATPSARVAIEAKCLTCHSPMARIEAQAQGGHFPLDALYADTELAGLGLDGVSCTVCHGITDEGLGSADSFGGHFVLSSNRSLFGPHEAPFSRPMVQRSGFEPVASGHILDSALCGSCHTLHTDAVDAAGVATGRRLPEQTPYLEWRNSSFTTEGAAPGPDAQSCQGCHLPTTDQDGIAIVTAIARNPAGSDFGPVGPRAPYGRHVLVGGNTLVPAMLRDHADELSPKAPAAAFDTTIEAARAQLTLRTARLTLLGAEPEQAMRAARFGVENLAGHKLPTAYPSRRVWLRVQVRDGRGQVVYETGGYDERGRLIGPDGAVLPSERAGGALLPHTDRVTDPASPQVWQSVMADGAGQPTFTLLRGEAYAKDNRILPRGWRVDGPDIADIAPVGTSADATFLGGGDEVTVLLPAPVNDEAYAVQAELLYQVISPRWVDELLRWDTAEVAAFRRYWEAADVRPEALARLQFDLR